MKKLGKKAHNFESVLSWSICYCAACGCIGGSGSFYRNVSVKNSRNY
jgi:hypothetical protein